MLEGVFIPLRRSRRWAAVHPTAAVGAHRPKAAVSIRLLDIRMVLFELFQHRLDKDLRVVVVAQVGQFLEIAARNILEQERRGQTAERKDRDIDQLAMTWRDR
jgi:hypothetical protein